MASKYVKNDLYYTKNLMVKITEKQKMMMIFFQAFMMTIIVITYIF